MEKHKVIGPVVCIALLFTLYFYNYSEQIQNMTQFVNNYEDRTVVFVEGKRLALNDSADFPKALRRAIQLDDMYIKGLSDTKPCTMDSCFDYSICPVSEKLKFYLYPPLLTSSETSYPETFKRSSEEMINDLQGILRNNSYVTLNSSEACIFILISNYCDGLNRSLGLNEKLPYWNRDGRNHIIWMVNCDHDRNGPAHSFGKAMFIGENAFPSTYRIGFDFVSPYIKEANERLIGDDIWQDLPASIVTVRKFLASYLGEVPEPIILTELLKIQKEQPLLFDFRLSCNEDFSKFEQHGENQNLSYLCKNETLRTTTLLESTFSIIILPAISTDIPMSNTELQLRLYESLKHGSIPFMIGATLTPPLSEVVNWSDIMIRVPTARITEIEQIMKSITHARIVEMRRLGRLVFEKHFGSLERVVGMVLDAVRIRIGAMAESFEPQTLSSINEPKPTEVVPTEKKRILLGNSNKYWNPVLAPSKRLRFNTPWDPFVIPGRGFDGINFQTGFNESLGGNILPEQFTIVMLTYEREKALLDLLPRFRSLPYLNKVVVIWNSVTQPPLPDLTWPDIGVPLHVLQAKKNSLNNRFLPLDVIETDAVLSLGDDIRLSHDDIVFGFRVWREERDRIVGFPGRAHALKKKLGEWYYHFNNPCEQSLVLTGAAFFHKVYSYMYTYEMPSSIRNKVDELMNCEDIALNFLVSHVTGKPPVKVTSGISTSCPGCSKGLSNMPLHYDKRNQCLNFFSRVYGYMPLLYTQFKVDRDQGKCFKTRG